MIYSVEDIQKERAEFAEKKQKWGEERIQAMEALRKLEQEKAETLAKEDNVAFKKVSAKIADCKADIEYYDALLSDDVNSSITEKEIIKSACACLDDYRHKIEKLNEEFEKEREKAWKIYEKMIDLFLAGNADRWGYCFYLSEREKTIGAPAAVRIPDFVPFFKDFTAMRADAANIYTEMQHANCKRPFSD